MTYVQLFITAWILTVLTETLVYFGLIKIWKTEIENWRIIFAGIITSSCTIPYLWFVMPNFWSGNELILIGELIVFLVEILILNGILNLDWKKSLILSLLANLASYGLGLMVMPLISG